MRWAGQAVNGSTDTESENALPGLARLDTFVRTVRTPDFDGVTFHEVLAKSALNKVPKSSSMPFDWTINPMRGCLHRCTYCFARGTHEYLGLDSGDDFDRQIVVKVNVVDVLAAELGRPSWRRERVALGTNTDPYQRAEGRYRFMPGIIAALAASGTPLSLLTKGTLLRRDLPLLSEAAQQVPVDIATSIAIFDDELQQSVEPGTPTASARLASITAAAELGLRPTVFLMPVLPRLTDSREHLDYALSRIAAAGASRVVYGTLHLRPGAREWFMQWLGQRHPELVPYYRSLYSRRSYAPVEYRSELAARIAPLLKKHRLSKQDAAQTRPAGRRPSPGPAASATPRAARSTGLIAAEMPALAARAIMQPTLF
ncbi:Rv2578c family radical SAM protein [Ruicaihuangia caeni]|uniref:Rv2578c family radical SAM protein n=1 Tax=Ruicaihuangia caeni TaxID=3042517 RepID=A0AAW6T383_9MICO|nr:Rv2578c family radical SAM protein [Klugiella sp. YN-L-19]MDI2098212.1 Rv2578c family radical SAM protein [Klugiella sp. YN-L-19]